MLKIWKLLMDEWHALPAITGGRSFHYYAGTVLVALGLVVRGWAVVKLGDYFTSTVMSHAGQHVITDGPYRFVRHPASSGGLLVYLGWAMASGSLIGLVLIPALLAWALIRRIEVGEKVIVENLGEPYQDYMQKDPLDLLIVRRPGLHFYDFSFIGRFHFHAPKRGERGLDGIEVGDTDKEGRPGFSFDESGLAGR